ncbi:MAG TPA: hypothetical protein VGB09_11720 [Candidatus Binatia bacterium]
MKTKTKVRQTTLGELVAGIMDAASRFTRDERDAYRITGLIVNHILCPVPSIVHPRVNSPRRRAPIR